MTTLRAGMGEVDITPKVGIELQMFDMPSTRVIERLHTKAIVFDNGVARIALIANDLIGIRAELATAVRRKIAATAGVAPSAVMICATHTHAGPTMLRKLVCSRGIDRKYERKLRRAMVRAVTIALSDMEPVNVGAGVGTVRFGINRRLKTANGIAFSPNPRGPVDREAGVLRVDTARGAAKAILINCACHPTTFYDGQLISPDYPGFTRRVVEKAFRNRVMTLSTTGACGDVRPKVTDKKGTSWGKATPATAKRFGNELGRKVVRVANEIRTRSLCRLGGCSRIVKLPMEKPMSVSEWGKRVTQAKKALVCARQPNGDRSSMMRLKWNLSYARRMRRKAERGELRRWIKAEIQVLRVGDLFLVGLPGEIFCEIGLRIKALFRPQKAFVVAYANDCVGYIPTAKAVAEGGYETTDAVGLFSLPAGFSARVEDVIVQAVGELRDQLEEGRLRGEA